MKIISNQEVIYTFLEHQQISHTFSYMEAYTFKSITVSNTKYSDTVVW